MKKCLLFLCLLVCFSLNATTYIYNGTGNWTDVGNWNTYPAPTGGFVTLNSGDLVQVPFGSDLNINLDILNAGIFEIYGSATNSGNFNNTGTFFVFGTFSQNANYTNLGSVKAGGIYGGNLENDGMLQPRGPAGAVDILDLFGDLIQDNIATVLIEIKGNGGAGNSAGHSKVDIWGTADLTGKLKIVLDNYDPVVGDEFSILTYFSKIGTFSTLELPDISPLSWSVNYLSGEMILKVDATVPYRSMDLEIKEENGKAVLSWNDDQETYQSFDIETLDNDHWTKIGTVLKDENLSFMDQNPKVETNYYRIKGIISADYYDYSEIVEMRINTPSEISFFPNPCIDIINIQFKGNIIENDYLLLRDVRNRMVLSKKITVRDIEQNNIQLDISHLQSGVHTLSIIQKKQFKTVHIVKS